MADLGGPSASSSRPGNGGSRLAPVGGDQPPRVMTPSDIMARRRERELRKAQAEEAERRRAEEQRRLSAERRAAAAGVVGEGSGQRRSSERPVEDQGLRTSQRSSGGSAKQQMADNTPTRGADDRPSSMRASGESAIPQPVSVPRSRAPSGSQQGQPRPAVPATTRAPPASNPQSTSTVRPAQTAATAGAEKELYTAPKTQTTQSTSQPRNGNTSSFPHAFERWEQLSSHWEGLTNYWIKRLESNSQEIKTQPINQQLARQVTDLSAAGANLFHAVVELQRLRASSERKFQRWFFETRSEQERTQDRIAKLEAELEAEREGRADDVRNGSRAVAENAKLEEAQAFRRRADEQMKEMRRELQISRDEARRGWEEIGRMEQAERDRTYSLKRGQPTLVGGVQVVPMPQGGTSRQTSSSRERHGQRPAEDRSEREGAYSQYDDVKSEGDADPFVEGGSAAGSRLDAPLPAVPIVSPLGSPHATYQTSASSAAAHQARAQPTTQSSPQRPVAVTSAPRPSPGRYEPPPAPAAPVSAGQPFYQQHGSGTALHEELLPPPAGSERSYGQSDTFSEEEYEIDEHGRIRRDAYGNPIPYRSAEELRAHQQGAGAVPAAPMVPPTSAAYPPSSNGHPAYGAQPDYSGAGYGDGYGGWGGVPRHSHPTRLSDVLEEDERSRTSPSRTSDRSRGFN